jgi:YfiH family protein
MAAEFLALPGFAARHGFFTRRGGVSSGPYSSLNASLSSSDSTENVLRNRVLVAEAMGVSPHMLLGVTQVHGTAVAVAENAWEVGQGPVADALVTGRRGMALGVVTADCAPVLFADAQAGVVGAAHAGWRGAVAGVLEETILAMERLGASRASLHAIVGPCIAQESYEVGDDLRDKVLADSASAARFFAPGKRDQHWQFDLAGYCLFRLTNFGLTPAAIGLDTCMDETRFFSHRRRTLRNEGPIGHQISVVVAE